MRQTIDITLNDGGLDKQFRIKEMDAWSQWQFLLKLAIALTECEGADAGAIDADWGSIAASIYNKLTSKGLASFRGLSFDKIQELSEILISCCYRVIDKYEQQITPDTVEKCTTLFKLQKEAFCINFSMTDWLGATDSTSQPSVVVGKEK